MGANRVADLSDRQLECMRLVARHKSPEDIAEQLGISPKTVQYHVREAIKKLGARGRKKACEMMIDLDCLPPEKITGEIPRVDFEAPIYSTVHAELEGRSQLESVASNDRLIDSWPPVLTQDSPKERGHDHVIKALKGVALVVAITVGLVLIVIGAKPMAESYQALANTIEPFHRN